MSQHHDCHTHVSCLEDLAFYYERGIVPCINVASRCEYKQVLTWKSQLDKDPPNPVPVHTILGGLTA